MLKISILRKSNKAEKEKSADLRNNKQTSQKQSSIVTLILIQKIGMCK